MASAPITKYQVMAKCIQIMTNQMRDSRHPEMKRRLRERIDFFSSFGVAECYQMIVYSNCITLVHSDFRNNPNLSLYDNGKLYIGCFDATLALNDPQCIRIHGDGKADSGACVHGYVEGECVTESLEREKGKEIKYKYESNNPYNAFLNDNKRVKNDMSLPLLKRLLKNDTIGQGDFFKGILLVIAVGIVLACVGLEVLSIIPGFFLLYIAYKRVADLGYSGGKAILILVLLCMFLHVIGFIVLMLLPSKVVSEDESRVVEEKLTKELASAEKALKTRCNTYNGSINWLLINADTMRIATSLAGGNNSIARPSNVESDDERERQREDEAMLREEAERQRQEEAERREEEERQRQEDEERREEEARARQISSLESQIRSLEGRISSLQSVASRAESQATSRRQQGETYLSYAHSTQDDALRNDYEQSADSCFSEAAQYESEAASAESEINGLQSEIDSLQSEINQLY